jgi:hypothetical protein
VVVLCFAGGPDDFFEVFYLVCVVDDSPDFLEFFNSVEDVEAFEDVIFV